MDTVLLLEYKPQDAANERMVGDTALLFAAMTVITILILLGDVVIMAIASTIAVMIQVPREWRSKVFGYTILADMAFSYYVFTSFAATAAVSGLMIGVLTSLGLSITLRYLGHVMGTERVAVNGSQRHSDVIAALATQGLAWMRSVWTAITTRTPVIAPTPLQWHWSEHTPAYGWIEGFRRLVSTV